MSHSYPQTHIHWLGIAVLCVVGLVACATPQPASDPNQILTLDEAVAQITDSVVAQMKKEGGLRERLQLPARSDHRLIAVDPMIDGISGQQTVLSAELQRRIIERLAASQTEFSAAPLTSDSTATNLLMTGTIALDSATSANGSAATARIQLAITDLGTGLVQAQASARARSDGFDITPNGFDQDSPVVLKDAVIQGYQRTAGTPPGESADAEYLRHLHGSTEIAAGTEAYNQTRYADSLQHFQAALSDPSGEQLRALNGSYLADVKLGRMDKAEQSFARIVAYGLENRDLGVKFLFNPNTTDFWSDQRISGPYDMWLRQIARGTAQSNVCVEVVGHASHTGSEAYNDKLSEQRAIRIRQKLVSEAPGLAGRVTTKGVGFRENIIGTGTDDARDAVDRRVSFRFQNCAEMHSPPAAAGAAAGP